MLMNWGCWCHAVKGHAFSVDSLPRHVGGLAQALLDWRVIYWLGLHRLLLTKRDSDWRSAHPRCKRECHNSSVAVSVCRTAAGRLVWVRVRWATEEQTRVMVTAAKASRNLCQCLVVSRYHISVSLLFAAPPWSSSSSSSPRHKLVKSLESWGSCCQAQKTIRASKAAVLGYGVWFLFFF
jgi:hypothetical protein